MIGVESCGRDAREAFDEIIEVRPVVTHESLAVAIQRIIRLRDALIAERRSEAPRRDGLLQTVNSILSLASSAQFPLVGVRWERIVAIREALKEMEQECAATQPTRTNGD